jgi:ribosomal protein L37AE/L43A
LTSAALAIARCNFICADGVGETLLDERGTRYRSVQPAYSSQQCDQCGFVHEDNRLSQSAFKCLNCGYTENADVNAARNIAKRFGDDELNRLHFRDVKAVLQDRFAHRLSPDARSASVGLDTLRKRERRVSTTVNQPDPTPCHICL